VFFSWQHCPLLQSRLPLSQRLWYSYGTWTYFCTIFMLPIFLAVPLVSLLFGVHPIILDSRFATYATMYYSSVLLLQSYCKNLKHLKSIWFMQLSNIVLWFTFTKAVANTLLSILGLKKLGFKMTQKTARLLGASATGSSAPLGSAGELGAPAAQQLQHPGVPVDYRALQQHPADVLAAAGLDQQRRLMKPGVELRPGFLLRPQQQPAFKPGYQPAEQGAVYLDPAHPQGFTAPLPPVSLPPPGAQQAQQQQSQQQAAASCYPGLSLRPRNLANMEGALDPAAIVAMLLLCLVAIGAGLYKMSSYQRISPDDPLVSPYITIPLLWAIYNAIAPYLFVHYCFSQGRSFRRACSVLRVVGNAAFVAAVVLVWLSLPREFNIEAALAKGLRFMSTQRELAAGFVVGDGGGRAAAA
jgi:hypothetical protein